ncbi:glutenin, high molecular weight subunit PW212-like [Lingula anatina]|uniref:Glutenin, high molecular weight subunit PW212-like n=1 Tax=Lingula anatina TaxID=7574 RepID=A0A1S3HR51_LINAN|nr:glutenin, high molecular weight subunit PW212-like [Lingula anatina]|eukprot:XP_013388515.1 glutenin, high molecular weight subunit PW212-like [Lingula anatina]
MATQNNSDLLVSGSTSEPGSGVVKPTENHVGVPQVGSEEVVPSEEGGEKGTIGNKKRSSFQITSVKIAKSNRQANDTINEGDADSIDELEESHTEDLSSELLDSSKVTEIHDGNESSDEETTTDQQLEIEGENKETASRFKVVKIASKEPFCRGRWSCFDFLDPPVVEKMDGVGEGSGTGSGNSSAASSVHYIPGVDDPTKNPFNPLSPIKSPPNSMEMMVPVILQTEHHNVIVVPQPVYGMGEEHSVINETGALPLSMNSHSIGGQNGAMTQTVPSTDYPQPPIASLHLSMPQVQAAEGGGYAQSNQPVLGTQNSNFIPVGGGPGGGPSSQQQQQQQQGQQQQQHYHQSQGPSGQVASQSQQQQPVSSSQQQQQNAAAAAAGQMLQQQQQPQQQQQQQQPGATGGSASQAGVQQPPPQPQQQQQLPPGTEGLVPQGIPPNQPPLQGSDPSAPRKPSSQAQGTQDSDDLQQMVPAMMTGNAGYPLDGTPATDMDGNQLSIDVKETAAQTAAVLTPPLLEVMGTAIGPLAGSTETKGEEGDER